MTPYGAAAETAMGKPRTTTDHGRCIRKLALAALTTGCLAIAHAPARADECGAVSCTDVTGEYIVRVMANVMKDMGSDCRSVRSVHLLDKSIDRIMMIYSVLCYDGFDDHRYQVFYWARDGEITIDKFSGASMRPLTKHYPDKVGLEER